MALYIVQHGKSLPREVGPAQGLSEEGRDEVKRMAEVAEGYRVKVSAIFCNGVTEGCLSVGDGRSYHNASNDQVKISARIGD